MSDFYAPNLIYTGSCPRTHWEHTALQPLTVFEGLTSKERGEEGLEGSGGDSLYVVPSATPTLSGPAHRTAKIILFTMSAT